MVLYKVTGLTAVRACAFLTNPTLAQKSKHVKRRREEEEGNRVLCNSWTCYGGNAVSLMYAFVKAFINVFLLLTNKVTPSLQHIDRAGGVAMGHCPHNKT